MKKVIFFIIILSESFISNSQNLESKNLIDEKFHEFLNSFITVEYPFNYKKEIHEIQVQNKELNYISYEDSKRYLNKSDNELITKRMIVDYETFEKSYVKENNLPASHLKFETEKYIGIIYRHDNSSDNEQIDVYLRLFTKDGEFLDEIKIGEQMTRESDWISSVFIDESNFKIYRYKLNSDNYKIDNGIHLIIDINKPKTIVTIEDYRIDEKLKIKLVKTYPPRKLKRDITFYKIFNAGTDDPMNEY